MEDWIKVTERLPLRTESIGHTYHEDGEIRDECFYDHEKKRWYRLIMDWEEEVYSPVTHWMLSPQPPKE